MHKTAMKSSPLAEAAGTHLTNLLLLDGAAKDKGDKTQKKAYAMGFAKVAESVGVDPERLYKLAWELKKKEKPEHSFRNTLTGLLGLGTSTTASTAAGAGMAALVNALSRGRIKADPFTGAAIGGLVGQAANGAGTLAALFTKRRSRAEQAAYDREGHALKNLFIPGYGAYNNFKRLGRAIGNTAEA